MWTEPYGPVERLSDRWRLAIASVFTIVFLGLAGTLGYRARTVDADDVGCLDKTPYGLLIFAALIVGITGLVILIGNVRRLPRQWSWARLASALCGLAMVVCAAAAVYLSAEVNSLIGNCD